MSRLEKIAQEAEQLDRHEQFLLVERLARNLGPTKEHQEAWARESQRRADAFDRGEMEAYDASEVFKQIRKLIGK